jgi:hypothetical protein
MRTRFATGLALTAALALAAPSAQAQQRDNNRRGGSEQRGAAQRGGEQRGSAQRGTAVPRGQARGESPRAQQGRQTPPRVVTSRPPARVVTSRPYMVRRDALPYRGAYNTRGRVRAVPRFLNRRAFIIGGPRFQRPYYTFRPRVSLSFGLWIGYPVAYPFYDVPYVYGTPYAYATPAPAAPYYDDGAPYDDSRAYEPAPGDGSDVSGQEPGGLSFTITPSSAAVFVDGVYVGTADEFGPTSQPLGLVPGQHRIEIRAEGYQTMVFDADVVAGQVVPYQATLRR